MRNVFGFLALLAIGTAPAAAQRAWQTEVGIQGGFTRLAIPGDPEPIDIVSIPGFNLGPAGPFPAAVYVVIPWKQKIAIEPEVALSQLYTTTGGTGASLASLGLRGNYALNRDFYAAAGGLLGYINNFGITETQLGIQAALGYRRRLTGPLNARIEARYSGWAKAENVGARNAYSVLLGVSTATRARPARAGTRATSRWSKQLGIAGGYASIHAVGQGSDVVTVALPGFGGGFSAFGAGPISMPPTLFAIFPVGTRVALEPGVDLHRAQSSGTTTFNANLALRLNYALRGGAYAALGGALSYLKTSGADAASRPGVTLAAGYRFAVSGPLGGRVEANYTLFGENQDAGIPPINTFAIMIGAMVPLR